MLSIFICEDDPCFVMQVRQCTENYVLMENLAMKVVCATPSPYEVIKYLQNNTGVAGLYFLDLDLGCDINGIGLAEEIRTHDPRGFIVFITSSGDSYKLTFERKVEAMDYIVKGDANLEARICECIRNAHVKLTTKATPLQDTFTFKVSRDGKGRQGALDASKGSIISIDNDKIMYFETSLEAKHNIVIYTTDGRLEFRGSLSQIEKLLNKKRFFRCQRNLIVNLEKVTELDTVQSEITFENGLVVDVAAKRINALKRRLKGAGLTK